MVSTRASTKSMITRSNSNGNTQFVELLPQKRRNRQSRTSPISIDECTHTPIPTPTPTPTPIYMQYETNIDFDEAHNEWMLNKKRTKNGTFVYICGYVKPNHKLCQKGCHDKIGLYSGCKTHYMWEEKIHKGFEELRL